MITTGRIVVSRYLSFTRNSDWPKSLVTWICILLWAPIIITIPWSIFHLCSRQSAMRGGDLCEYVLADQSSSWVTSMSSFNCIKTVWAGWIHSFSLTLRRKYLTNPRNYSCWHPFVLSRLPPRRLLLPRIYTAISYCSGQCRSTNYVTRIRLSATWYYTRTHLRRALCTMPVKGESSWCFFIFCFL